MLTLRWSAVWAGRWHQERRCALQTAVDYSGLRGRLPCWLVVAGLEPAAFQQLFPAWSQHREPAQLNRQVVTAPSTAPPPHSPWCRLTGPAAGGAGYYDGQPAGPTVYGAASP